MSLVNEVVNNMSFAADASPWHPNATQTTATRFESFNEFVECLGVGFWETGDVPATMVFYIDEFSRGRALLNVELEDISKLEEVVRRTRLVLSPWLLSESQLTDIHFVSPQPSSDQRAGGEVYLLVDGRPELPTCPIMVVTKSVFRRHSGPELSVNFDVAAARVPFTVTMETLVELHNAVQAYSRHQCDVEVSILGKKLWPGQSVVVRAGLRVDVVIQFHTTQPSPPTDFGGAGAPS